jgi:hypothetical protein
MLFYLHICSLCGNQFPYWNPIFLKNKVREPGKKILWTDSLLKIQNSLLGKEFLESSTMGDLCRVFNLEPEYRQRQKELGMDEESRNEKKIFFRIFDRFPKHTQIV